jgi:hypothetical protein
MYGLFANDPQPTGMDLLGAPSPATLSVAVRESSAQQDRGTTAATVGHLHPDAVTRVSKDGSQCMRFPQFFVAIGSRACAVP